MHIKVAGSGPDLVLLHGWGMHAEVWHETAVCLAKKFRVHSVDLPGHGDSPACVPYTLDAMVATVAAACPRQAAVCGWSLGGQLAMRWALARPDQVERLMLIASTPRFVRTSGWDSGMDAAVLDAYVQDVKRDAGSALRRFALLQAHGDHDARNVSRQLRECLSARGEAAATALAGGLRILRETDLRAGLASITQPALILHGDRDTVVPFAAGEYLASALPNSTLEIVAGAAHAPFIGRAGDVARRIEDFCGG